MIRNTIIFVTLLCAVAFSWTKYDATDNWNGNDTSTTASIYAKFDTLKFTKAFKLSQFENLRVIVKTDDTTTARFASDSIGVRWGYQTLCPSLSSTGVADTTFDQLIKVDSILPANFGDNKARIGTIATDGTITRSDAIVDTLGPSGYVTQSRWIQPEWDVYIRFWVRGITGNKITTACPVVFEVQRRVYNPTRAR